MIIAGANRIRSRDRTEFADGCWVRRGAPLWIEQGTRAGRGPHKPMCLRTVRNIVVTGDGARRVDGL